MKAKALIVWGYNDKNKEGYPMLDKIKKLVSDVLALVVTITVGMKLVFDAEMALMVAGIVVIIFAAAKLVFTVVDFIIDIIKMVKKKKKLEKSDDFDDGECF